MADVFFVKVELIIIPNSSALSSNVSPTSSASYAWKNSHQIEYSDCLCIKVLYITLHRQIKGKQGYNRIVSQKGGIQLLDNYLVHGVKFIKQNLILLLVGLSLLN